jgi:hypothetical protein
VKASTSAELTQLTHTIAQRVARCLERQGLLERDAENSYLAADAVERGHWSRPHERPLSVFGLACGYPPRMAGHGTLEPVDVALHEAALETKPSFAAMQQFSDIDRISRQGCSFSNRPQPVGRSWLRSELSRL